MNLVVYFFTLVLLIDRSLCRSECVPSQCLQSINPFSCPERTLFQDKVSMGGCCPGCVRFRGNNVECFNHLFGHFVLIHFKTGPDEPCHGESTESFDVTTYYSSRTYIPTGNKQPVIESQLCAPGVNCTNGLCSQCMSY